MDHSSDLGTLETWSALQSGSAVAIRLKLRHVCLVLWLNIHMCST